MCVVFLTFALRITELPGSTFMAQSMRYILQGNWGREAAWMEYVCTYVSDVFVATSCHAGLDAYLLLIQVLYHSLKNEFAFRCLTCSLRDLNHLLNLFWKLVYLFDCSGLLYLGRVVCLCYRHLYDVLGFGLILAIYIYIYTRAWITVIQIKLSHLLTLSISCPIFKTRRIV
jgi:hypothetical protein